MEVEEDERPLVESVEDFIRPYVKKLRAGSSGSSTTTTVSPDINVGDVDGASATLASIENDIGAEQEESDDDKDPYEVTLAEFRRVSHEEFAHSLVEPIDYTTMQFHFNDMVQAARHQSHEQHDPITLIKAVAVACNLKGWARLVASRIPHTELQTLEDYDTTKLLQYIRNKPEAKQKMDQMMGEFMYACMTVDMATTSSQLPQPIARVLGDVGSSSSSSS